VAALSFPFEFPTEEAAAQFVRSAVAAMGIPCFRDGILVHVIVVYGRDIDDLMQIAKQLGGRPVLA